MSHALYFLAMLAVLAYIMMIFAKEKLNANQFMAADMLMGTSLMALIVKGNRSLLVFMSLLWLAANYMVRLPSGNIGWYAYDGFAIASILAQVPSL